MTSPVSLDDAKAHLNKTNTADDDELQKMIDAACSRISYEVGPLAPEDVVEDHVEPGTVIIPRKQPATAVTSVVDQPYLVGQSFTATSLWRLAGGVLYRQPFSPLDAFSVNINFPGPPWLTTITYTAGWNPLPPDLRLAVLELVRHFWLTQQGSRSRSDPQSQQMRGSQEMIMQAMGYSLPNRVKELLEPYRQRTRAA